MRMLRIVLMLGLLLNAALSHSQSFTAGDVTIEHPWARATAKGSSTGVVYLTIINNGATNDKLISITSAVSQSAQVHENTVDAQGMTEMSPLDKVDIPAHARVALKPTARHVMLLDLKNPLTYKSTFPLTLSFEKAGAIKVIVTVEKPGAMTFDKMDGMKM
ncbi:MAG TPA: copper chaperone PCu(A)C [Herbaspirillum sp.]|nr:copper chaperone PCu(A)C [Herbaspirillum sp.]